MFAPTPTCQNGIGKNLKKWVSVRQTVGVNSDFIRGIQIILAEDGYTHFKSYILLGGPDWPTAVLCGILDLSLADMLLATQPIFFLIMPTCGAGALLLKKAEGGVWQTIGSIMLTVSGLVQLGCFSLAANHVNATVRANRDQIDAMPLDEEVKRLDDKNEEKARVFRAATAWHASADSLAGVGSLGVPLPARVLLVTAAGLMAFSLHYASAFADKCFVPFEVVDSIADLPGGKVSAVVLDGGWLVTGAFFASLFVFKVRVYHCEQPLGMSARTWDRDSGLTSAVCFSCSISGRTYV